MKILRLIFSRIISDFSKNKSMMVLYMVGSVLCVLVFIYFYNNIQVLFSQYETVRQSSIFREYTVTFNEAEHIKSSDLDFLKDYNVENIRLTSAAKNKNNEQIDIAAFSSSDYISNLTDDSFSLSDEQMNSNIVILNEKFCRDSKFKLNGIEFDVINQDISDVLIPLNSFLSNNFPTEAVKVLVPERLTPNENA